jgi:uncharacterized protein
MKASRREIGSFDIATLPALIKNCSLGFDEVEFCWHGGEPLLAGKEFYRQAMRIEREVSASFGTQFRNVMQTNGILLDRGWVDFFKEEEIAFGFSFDAPPEVHRLHRGDNAEKVIAAWELTRAANLPVGVICVISRYNVHKAGEIFDFFSAHGVTSYSFLPLRAVPARDLPPLPTNDEVSALFSETFELWLSRGNDFSSIDPISTMVKALIDGNPQACSFAASCPEKMISIDHNGNVIPCSSLVEDEFIMGNIFTSSLADIIERRKKPLIQLRGDAQSAFCIDCEYAALCNGGCRADAYWATGRYAGRYPHCDARKSTFSYLKNRLQQLGVLA